MNDADEIETQLRFVERLSDTAGATLKETEDYYVADFEDGLPIFEQRVPTKKNPDILVDVGSDNGKLKASRVYYPKSRFTREGVVKILPEIIKRRESCSVCERLQRSRLIRSRTPLQRERGGIQAAPGGIPGGLWDPRTRGDEIPFNRLYRKVSGWAERFSGKDLIEKKLE